MSEPIWNLAELQEAFKDERVISLDLETTGFSPWKADIAVIGLYGPTCGRVGILHYPLGRRVPLDVMRWLESFDEIVTHNGTQFDILFLGNNGMDWKKVRWYDTMIGEQSVLATARKDVEVNLGAVVARRFNRKLDKKIDHSGWGNLELNQNQIDYVTGDIAFLHRLRDLHFEKASTSVDMMRCLEFEMALIPTVLEMEFHGIPIDMRAWEAYRAGLEPTLLVQGAKIHDMIGKDVLLTSPIQLRKRLGEMFGDRLFPDTKAERFQEYSVFDGPIGEISRTILEWRGADTRRKMFSDKWRQEYVVDHGRGHSVHGKFWQVGTDTGRFSGSNPNLQQVPRDARYVYAAWPGESVGKTDYSQIEVRVAAALAGDTVMIDAFESEDIHRFVAAETFEIPIEEVTEYQRNVAKAESFTLLFGGGVDGFIGYANQNGAKLGRATGEELIKRFFDRFKGLAEMRRYAVSKADSGKHIVIVYPTGLKRILAGADLKATIYLNNIVQGTAAAGLKYALVECQKAGVAQYLSAVVHDEIVYAAPTKIIKDVVHEIEVAMVRGMEIALRDCLPLRVGVESTWGPTWKGLKENNTTYSERVNVR